MHMQEIRRSYLFLIFFKINSRITADADATFPVRNNNKASSAKTGREGDWDILPKSLTSYSSHAKGLGAIQAAKTIRLLTQHNRAQGLPDTNTKHASG